MDMKTYYQTKTKEDLIRLAELSQTSFDNLKQIFLYGGSVSTSLASKLSKNSNGELPIYELKPELKEVMGIDFSPE